MDQNVLTFSLGLLSIVLLGGIVIGASSIIWAWKNPEEEKKLIEAKQLHFAAATLTGLGLLFALGMAMYYWGAQNPGAKDIFEACKTIIPPIVTLVLGYYFGRDRGGQAKSSGTVPKAPESK